MSMSLVYPLLYKNGPFEIAIRVILHQYGDDEDIRIQFFKMYYFFRMS